MATITKKSHLIRSAKYVRVHKIQKKNLTMCPSVKLYKDTETLITRLYLYYYFPGIKQCS